MAGSGEGQIGKKWIWTREPCDYDNLKAEDLLIWQRRAFREWAFRPAPMLTFLKSMNTWEGFKSALDIGKQTLGWLRG
jgi:hypothetical protein